LRRRRGVIALHFSAYSCLIVLSTSFLTWGPAFLFRTHKLPGGVVGTAMGIAAGLFGMLGFYCGGTLADYWLRKGQLDAHMKVAHWSAFLALPVGLLVTLSADSVVAVVGLCCLMFLVMAPIPAGVAGLQLITPPLLRGRVSAIYMVISNLLGIGLGPILPALLNDYVFKSKAAMNLSLAIIVLAMLPPTIVMFGLVRRSFGACVAAEAVSADQK
jgi:hypothetical protein